MIKGQETPTAKILQLPDHQMKSQLFLPKSNRLDPSNLSYVNKADGRTCAYFDEYVKGYAIFTKSSPEQELNHAVVEVMVIGEDDSNGISISKINLGKSLLTTDETVVFGFEFFTAFPKIKLIEPVLKVSVKATYIESAKEPANQADSITLDSVQPPAKLNILEGLNFSITLSSTESPVVLLDSFGQQGDQPESGEQGISEISCELETPIIRTLNIRIRNIRLKNNVLISTLDLEHSSKAKQDNLAIDLISVDFKANQLFHPAFKHVLPIALSKDGSYNFSYLLLQQSPVLRNPQVLIEIKYRVNDISLIHTNLYTNINSKITSNTLKSGSSTVVNTTPVLSTNGLSNTVTVKFVGNKVVKIGKPFKLRVFVSNHSSKDRHLLMIFNPNASQNTMEFQPSLPKIKSLIHSTPTLLETYTNMRLKTQGILALINEIQFKLKSFDSREGQNVAQNEIELIALEIGVFNLQGVRLLDLATGETFSCDRLLEIVVEP